MNPVVWTAWKLRLLDIAELGDAYRVVPRICLFWYLWNVDRVTTWYFAKPDPTAAETSFATGIWGFLIPLLGWYFSTGRKWQ